VARSTDVFVGALSESLREQVADAVPAAETFVPGFGVPGDGETTGGPAIGRLVIVDRSTVVVSTLAEDGEEHAVFGGGSRNGVVVLGRQLVAQAAT
jgi:hypothetical protein